jgi:probable addiction module antidote protein
MAIETTAWDPSALLTSDKAIQEYLEIAFEDGDTTDIAIALGNIAKAKGMTAVAKDAGITREALYKSLSEKGDPKLSTLLGVMKALGLQLTVVQDGKAA